MRIAAIIQARVNSTRLPNKVLRKINKKPMLLVQLKRISFCRTFKQIIIAIPKGNKNDYLFSILEKNNHIIFRGSEKNVLKRYYDAACKFKIDAIIRITSDNPLIPIEVIDKVVNKFKTNKYDYVSNVLPLTFPLGCGVEMLSFKALEKVYLNAKSSYDKEHVTSFIHKNKKKFKIYNLASKINLPKLRLTVDENKDFLLIKKIFNHFKPDIKFSLNKIIKLFEKNPHLFFINKNVKQKNFVK